MASEISDFVVRHRSFRKLYSNIISNLYAWKMYRHVMLNRNYLDKYYYKGDFGKINYCDHPE